MSHCWLASCPKARRVRGAFRAGTGCLGGISPAPPDFRRRGWIWCVRVSRGNLAYILADGWVCSYKLLPSGTRQIVDFQVPGDFLGLRSVLFRTSDHNVEAMTKVEVSEVSSNDLIDAFANTPRLATAVLWAASRDEAMVVEHLVDIGRRNALETDGAFPAGTGCPAEVGWSGHQGGLCLPDCRNTCWPMHWG